MLENSPDYKRLFNDLPQTSLENTLKLNVGGFKPHLGRLSEMGGDFHYLHNEGDITAGTRVLIEATFSENYRGKIIKLDHISLPKDTQNQKQGVVTLARLMNLGVDHSFDRIELSALNNPDIGTIGGYAWAALGGKPFSRDINTLSPQNDTTEKDLVDKYISLLENPNAGKGADRPSILNYYDVSQDGREQATDDHWPGKDYLLENDSWSGGYNFHDQQQMRLAYRIINSKIQDLMIDITEGRNTLFKAEDIAPLLGRTQEIGAQYENAASLSPEVNRSTSEVLNVHKSSAVNKSGVESMKALIKDLRKLDQEKMAEQYPGTENYYQELIDVVKFVDSKQPPGSSIHAKLTSIFVERSMGSEAYREITKGHSQQLEID
ncbi:hypothetical protein MNBD_GAMMA12-1136 [hydrothermal vent metagenome]|uniref:Uncharacterized protein n=1 Tax=hydrothermal vent metagenome TaxID=652676 RepID=A0A3B0YZ62_9ZZZZ